MSITCGRHSMWTCTHCNEEVDDGFDVCWNCGTSLVGELDTGFAAEQDGIMTPQTHGSMKSEILDQKLIVVARFDHGSEAYLAQASLAAEGIRSFITSEMSSGLLWGTFGSSVLTSLEVIEADAEKAYVILRRQKNAPQPLTREDIERACQMLEEIERDHPRTREARLRLEAREVGDSPAGDAIQEKKNADTKGI